MSVKNEFRGKGKRIVFHWSIVAAPVQTWRGL